jgi:hypothetical protein
MWRARTPRVYSTSRAYTDVDGDGRGDVLYITEGGVAEQFPTGIEVVYGQRSGDGGAARTTTEGLTKYDPRGAISITILSLYLAIGGREGLDDYDYTMTLRLNARLALNGNRVRRKAGKTAAGFSRRRKLRAGSASVRRRCSRSGREHSVQVSSETCATYRRAGVASSRRGPPVTVRVENPDGHVASLAVPG